MGVHLWFDRRIDCPPALAILDRATEWIFNKTALFDRDGFGVKRRSAPTESQSGDFIDPGLPGEDGETQSGPPSETYLSLVMSASRKYSVMPQEEIVAIAVREVEACLPGVRGATLVRSRVIRWPKATFSPRPGVDALRPDQRSPISNLFVAGEWTQTGWPSTDGGRGAQRLSGRGVPSGSGRHAESKSSPRTCRHPG